MIFPLCVEFNIKNYIPPRGRENWDLTYAREEKIRRRDLAIERSKQDGGMNGALQVFAHMYRRAA